MQGGIPRALTPETSPCQLAKLRVGEIHQLLARRLIAVTPLDEQLAHAFDVLSGRALGLHESVLIAKDMMRRGTLSIGANITQVAPSPNNKRIVSRHSTGSEGILMPRT